MPDSTIININNSNIAKLKHSDECYLVILIGAPASGKSTFTNSIKALSDSVVVHSTDSYFMNNGKYEFDANKLSEFHRKNVSAAINSMREKQKKIVVIDNTNLSVSDFKEYVKAANTYGYKVLFHIFDVNVDQLKKRSEKRKQQTGKDIGESTIERMYKKLQDNLNTIVTFISKYNQGYFQDKIDTSDVSNFIYSGIFFAPDEILKMSKDLNLNLRPSKQNANAHVTLVFNKDRGAFEKHIDSIKKKIGEKIPVVIKKIISNHRVKTAIVSIPKIDNTIFTEPHITLQTYGDAKPFESNTLIDSHKKGVYVDEIDHKRIEVIDNINYALEGKVGLYTKQNTVVFML